jgi:hypothetical membrane protein
MKKTYAISGILAPLFYVITVIIGSLLRPGYSQISQAISELIESGAPNKTLLDLLFIFYNSLIIVFGYWLFKQLKIKGRYNVQIGAIMLLIIGVLGLAMTMFFPMDPRGTEATLPGTIHLILAGVLSLLTILTILFTGFGFKDFPLLANLKLYSLITAIVVVASGGMAAFGASTESAYMGLFERITIGAFLQWIFVVALRLFLVKEKEEAVSN